MKKIESFIVDGPAPTYHGIEVCKVEDVRDIEGKLEGAIAALLIIARFCDGRKIFGGVGCVSETAIEHITGKTWKELG